jgi:hypothetical protein
LEGLELGVAGLVYALASVGCVPAASCRGHSRPHAWAERPIVLLAADRARAEWLRPLVSGAGCGFCLDDVRPQILGIEAPSIDEMTALARLVLDSSKDGLQKSAR